jgi:hypothetical protein
MHLTKWQQIVCFSYKQGDWHSAAQYITARPNLASCKGNQDYQQASFKWLLYISTAGTYKSYYYIRATAHTYFMAARELSRVICVRKRWQLRRNYLEWPKWNANKRRHYKEKSSEWTISELTVHLLSVSRDKQKIVFSCFFFFSLGVGWDRVRLVRRPLFSLSHQPPMIDDECGAVGGMRIGRRNRSTRRKPGRVTFFFVHHKSHMTWSREAGN